MEEIMEFGLWLQYQQNKYFVMGCRHAGSKV